MSLITYQLSREHFEQYPVWANFDAPDEFETILAWGEKGAQIVRELKAAGPNDALWYPVLELNERPDGSRYVTIGDSFRAIITAADGTEFPGCLNRGSVELFIADDHFYFGHCFGPRPEETLLRLRQTTGRRLSPFLPLRYKTEFREENGERIEGFFGYDDQVTRYLLQEYGVNLQVRDLVRVASLRLSDREYYEEENKPKLRPPKVGDVGRLIRCYDPARYDAPFVVVCIDTSGTWYESVWKAAFAADELELVSRPE